jgi:hypothetical protein
MDYAYMHAMPKTGINIILVLAGMFKFHIKKIGNIAKVKSEIIAQALYRKVRAMMTSMGTQ